MYNYEEMVVGVIPEIVDRELIRDGLGTNYRVRKQRYFVDNLAIDEVFIYKYNASHPAWLAVKEHYFEEADIRDINTFREWSISNHPIQTDIQRKLFLTELMINSHEVKVTVIMKHYFSNGYKADIADKVFTRTGDDRITYQFQGQELTEREYWDYLTKEYNLTPYQLLDMRVPEMDGLGVFNNYEI